MDFNFSKLQYVFLTKPILVGGKAMEYYGLRKGGEDVDFIVTKEDYEKLTEKYPDKKKDILGDLGVVTFGLEIWRTIRWFDYDFYSHKAIELTDIKVISLERLLFMKTLAIDIPKYKTDVNLLIQKINSLSMEERRNL